MRRFLSLFTMLMLCGVFAFAQTRVVSGKVTDKSSGSPVPFASVKVKGTRLGLSADATGAFSIKVKDGDVLEISGSGFKTLEVPVGSSTVLNISLEGNSELKEVVVTSAFQIKRTQRSTTSNVQAVSGESVNTIRQANVNNALAGKVAGLQVRSQSVVALDGGASIRLGGESGLNSGGNVLYVVDGTQMPNANDISPDDVEDYNVLQGPAATALYGPAGQNGVIVITLKKARKLSNGIGLEVNTGMQFDRLYILPNYQNSYAGGSQSDMIKYTYKAGDPIGWKALDGKYYTNYDDDASWGPRMVGQEYIPWYAWYGGSEYAYKTAKLTPQPTNSADYYNTGVTSNSNINFSKAADNYNIRASYSNLDVKGLIPNSTLKRNMLTLTSGIDLNSHFTLNANINYVTQNVNGTFGQGYSNQTTGSFNSWFHRNLDMGIMKELRGLTTPDGILASWNHNNPGVYSASAPVKFFGGNYWYNPYTYMDYLKNTNHRDRLYGNVALTYKVNSDLSFKVTYRKAQNTTFSEGITSSILEKSATQTGLKAGYSVGQTNWNKENFEGVASYSKKFNDFSLNANAGFDFFNELYRSVNSSTNGGLSVDNLYTLANSKNPITYGSSLVKDKYRAIFATATFGFRNYLFVDGTAREDYFSTLPADKNGIFSKSAGVSFVFSDLLKKSLPFLSYGKIKASWGEIPGTLGDYTNFYGAYNYPGALYGIGTAQWNGNILTSVPNSLTDPAIHGAVAIEKNIGLELSFLKSRVGFTVNYRQKITKDFPYSVAISGTSGIGAKIVNTGEVDQNNIDVTFNAKPLWFNNLQWELNSTFSKNIKNTVVSIAPGVDKVAISAGAAFSGITPPKAYIGTNLRWGSLIGGGYKLAANGKPLLDASGLYIADPNVNFGSVLPDYTGGVQNTITLFKNFEARVNIDYQVGGKFFSLSDMWGSFSGLTARTATLNDKGNPIRDAVADGGGVHVFGVDQTSGKDVDYYVEAQDYFHGLVNRNVFNDFIYDLTFVKLRELSFGYKVPVSKLAMGKFIKNLTFSIVARNPILIYAKTKDFDPSEITSVYGEDGQFPGTRSVGFNLKVGF